MESHTQRGGGSGSFSGAEWVPYAIKARVSANRRHCPRQCTARANDSKTLRKQGETYERRLKNVALGRFRAVRLKQPEVEVGQSFTPEPQPSVDIRRYWPHQRKPTLD